VVVLGCRVRADRPSGALERRLERARTWARENGSPDLVIMSGGKSWDGHVESEVMANWWTRRALGGAVVPERYSQNTRQNAEHTRRILSETAADAVIHLVTCDYHMARAQAEFRRFGQASIAVPARSPRGWFKMLKRYGRELVARVWSLWMALAFLTLSGCQNAPPREKDAAPSLLGPRLVLPEHPGMAQGLRARAREPEREDEDLLRRALLGSAEQRRWGAFGLGLLCERSPENSKDVEDSLISAASMWLLSDPLPSQSELIVLSLALGGCATDRAEIALRAWLRGSGGPAETRLSRAAAYGLGAMVDRRGRLDDQTLSRLLDLAESTKTASLLYPLGRIARLSRAVSERTIEVAGKLLLSGSSESLRDAIFALGSAGSAAGGALSAIASSSRYKLTERTAAAQALARLGEVGNRALDHLAFVLIDSGVPSEAKDPKWIVLLATLNALAEADESSEALDLIRRGPLPELDGASTDRALLALRRRLIHLRCRAAELQAKAHYDHKHLQNCDPDRTAIGKLAALRALDKTAFDEKASKFLAELLSDTDPVVAESALFVGVSHREFSDTKKVTLDFGGSPKSRLRGAALRAIATRPERFQTDNLPDPGVVELVQKTLTHASETPQVHLAALDAAGSLRALSLKPHVEAFCRYNSVSGGALAKAARRALGLLGDPKHPCSTRSAQPDPNAGDVEARSYELDTELGRVRITLQSEQAPLAVSALAAQFGSGTYERAKISSAREGFLAEWSVPRTADEADKFPVIYAELSPDGPRAGDILFQPPETPGGQGALLFALSDAPQLAGRKAIVGRFEGPLELLVPGDSLTLPRAPAPSK
jgi:DUF218 domain